MNLDRPIELIIKEKGSKVFTVAADATVYEALVIMAEREIGALVVVDGDDFVGVFSERDYARKVVLAGRSSREMKVHEIMSSKVVTVGPKSTVNECMQYMTDKRCRHLPVMEGKRLVGIVSIGDLVNWIIQIQDRAIPGAQAEALPAGVDYSVFDYGVNSGIGRSGKVLRRVVGLPDNTHVVTDEVLRAVAKRDPKALVIAINDERLAFLKRLKTWPVFGTTSMIGSNLALKYSMAERTVLA